MNAGTVRRLYVAVGILVLMAMTAATIQQSGWRINLTESEPMGLYRMAPMRPDFVIHRGSRVEFCPPDAVTPERFPFYMRGNCPNGGMPMFKTIAGVPGDVVEVSSNGVLIDHRQLPYSNQVERSKQFPWVTLPHQSGKIILGPQQYWVYGSGAQPEQAAQSFDSRYWGAIKDSQIRAVSPKPSGLREHRNAIL
ncbi:S26 family signal peptidase [Ferrovum sp.]|uniref:S26 family signal peptidase n=1 Tax=Ferrovum sp. TaxID=2609467 RepID=UPI002632B798|nr:S26 family signal peptidase [Ferrovum sp.]